MKASLQFLQSKSQLAIGLKTPGFRQKLAADHMRQRISVKKSTQYYPTRCQVAVIRFDLSIASILTRLSLQRREGPPLFERVFLPNHSSQPFCSKRISNWVCRCRREPKRRWRKTRRGVRKPQTSKENLPRLSHFSGNASRRRKVTSRN